MQGAERLEGMRRARLRCPVFARKCLGFDLSQLSGARMTAKTVVFDCGLEELGLAKGGAGARARDA